MYYYVIKDTWTGETLAEGTAVQLVESGKYVSAESVSNAYNGWRRRKEKHGESRVEWVRTGERNRRERKKLHRKRKRAAKQGCTQAAGAEAGRPNRPGQHGRPARPLQQNPKSRTNTLPRNWVIWELCRNTQSALHSLP